MSQQFPLEVCGSKSLNHDDCKCRILTLECQLYTAQDELERLKNCREYQIIKWIDDRILAVWNWLKSEESA